METINPPPSSVRYYSINEDAVRRAKEAMSFSDYAPGCATAEYRGMVEKAAILAGQQKRGNVNTI